MSLMVWFRKNNKKLMAFVVIVLMLVFVLEPAMNYLGWRRQGGQDVVARYGNNQKITRQDLALAQKQLELLSLLGANFILRPQDPRMIPSQDLQTVLLGELVLAERATAVETIGRVRQLARMGDYGISDKQISDIYAKKYPSNIYWLMLVREAQMAGIRTPYESAKVQISRIISNLSQGATYEQVVGSIVAQQGVSEEQILQSFADMMAVVEYCRTVCSIQSKTMPQILHQVNWQQESIDTEYVLFDSSIFSSQARSPKEEQITEQFEKYKGNFAGDVSEDNPYGFGYKQPDRVKLEYVAVKMDDIATTVPRPSQQETEEYYQQHLSQYTRNVLSDPNDPNSEIIAQTRSYAEVAGFISRGLYQQRVDSKAEQILLDVKSITEVNLGDLENEQAKLSDEQIKTMAVDYKKTADQLSDKYKIKVYSGETSLLSAADIQQDPQLNSLYISESGSTSANLVRVLFAVKPLDSSTLGSLDVKPPRLYENIGPLRDVMARNEGFSGRNMVLARVIETQKSSEPENIDKKLVRKSLQLNHEDVEDANSIKKSVIDDLKRLAAMEKTGEKANQFVQVAATDGWDKAIEKFNELYSDNKDNGPNSFALEIRKGLRRISDEDIRMLEIQHTGDPLAKTILDDMKTEKMLLNKFCSVLPEDSNSLALSGTVLEFKPTMSYYCLKSLILHQLYKEKFNALKAGFIVRNSFADAQALAVVHYNPENILKRMNFKLEEEQERAEPNSVIEPNDQSNPIEGI